MVLDKYRKWFYAAAAYNFIWGVVNILFPTLLWDALSIDRPLYLPLWQVVGMFVLVYAPAYYWAGRHPDKYALFIVIGLLGKIFGPVGFVFSVATGQFPIAFGITIVTNDLIWWIPFALYLRDIAKMKGGWIPFLLGD